MNGAPRHASRPLVPGRQRPVSRGRGHWGIDVAPKVRLSVPDAGIGRGWESTLILALVLILLVFGLLTLHSVTSVMAQREALPHYHYTVRQGGGVLLGLLLMAVLARIPTAWWSRAAPYLMVGAGVLLIVVVLPFTEAIAPTVNGARRWLRAGVMVQPSELAKLAVVIWTASLLVRKREQLGTLTRGIAPLLVGWAYVLVPVVLGPDLSTACLILAVGATMVFLAGARIAHFVFLGLLFLPISAPLLWSGYRSARWESLLLNPGAPPTEAGFQSYQSLVAIGSGGVGGVGFGEGRQKFGFLPEVHNDFIFATIGEEWGFVGVVVLILCFLALVVVGVRVARRARDRFGELLAVGVTTLIGLQAFVHIGVGLGLLPATGLTLPFISYGRSSVVVTLAAVGILLAVAREAPEGRLDRREGAQA